MENGEGEEEWYPPGNREREQEEGLNEGTRKRRERVNEKNKACV